MRTLIINTILGVVLLLLTNLILADDIPINLLTVIICAIGGVIGWLVILILHLLGVSLLSVGGIIKLEEQPTANLQ